jgi:hypothetical protein
MRKITTRLFFSLHGVVEAPDRWHFPYFNEETGAPSAPPTPSSSPQDLLWLRRGMGHR